MVPVWHSASALFTTWRIRLARFAGSLEPGDRPQADYKQYAPDPGLVKGEIRQSDG